MGARTCVKCNPEAFQCTDGQKEVRKLNLSDWYEKCTRFSPEWVVSVHLHCQLFIFQVQQAFQHLQKNTILQSSISGLLWRKQTKTLGDLDHRKQQQKKLSASGKDRHHALHKDDFDLMRTCVCPTLAAAVSACCAACVFPVTVSLLWCCCGSAGVSAPHSWPSKMLMISACPFSPAWTSAHWPLLSAWPTWHRGAHRKANNTGSGQCPYYAGLDRPLFVSSVSQNRPWHCGARKTRTISVV